MQATTLAVPQKVGAVPLWTRVKAPIASGEFEDPSLRGKVLQGGGDVAPDFDASRRSTRSRIDWSTHERHRDAPDLTSFSAQLDFAQERPGARKYSSVRELPPGGAKLKDYEAFLAIVDTGNLTQAATRLRRSVQSVSRSLSALEAQVGIVLIRRTTRVAQPTEAGLAFHGRLSAAFREIALAEGELGDTSETLNGTLRVTGSAYFVGLYVVPAIRDFSVLHPGIKFDLSIAEEFTEPVRTRVDLVIRIGHLPSSPMKLRKIASLRSVAIASTSYIVERGRPEDPASLARHACIITTSAHDARTWTFQARDGTPLRVPVQGIFEADNAYVTMHAVLAGMGIAIVPFYHAREAVETGLAEIVLDEFTLAPTTAHALWPSDSRTPLRVRRFVDLLAQRLKKEVI
jgi:DNA-binding transcriptional LysR family regulator